MGKRIGFLLANISSGSSLSMWRSIASAAEKDDESALFVFPGGRLKYTAGNEYLRNSIYDLADRSSLDGAIIWASSLTGSIGTEEAESFVLGKSRRMPVVAIGMPIKGCPCVNFDAYSGMKEEVEHLISVHGDRRIAFLRGPDNHNSAESRFEAYKDALGKHGIALDPCLVSSPHPWSDGMAAVREIVDERGLVPGKDFTALVAASDLLLLSAVRYLERLGVDIPRDLHAAGFNDNEENVLMAVEPTTVRMPIDRLASSSYTLLSSMEATGESGPDLLLSADLIVRRSCGCRGLGSEGKFTSVDDRFWRASEHRIGRKEAFPAFRKLVSYLSGEGDDAFLSAAASDFIASGGDSDALFEVVSSVSGIFIEERKDRFYLRIAFEERKARTVERERTRMLTKALDLFKTELLAVRSISSLPAIMQSSLGTLGIGKCFLMLYDDFSTTTFAGGFSNERVYEGGESFPRGDIAPEGLSEELLCGTFVIEPLFYDIEELGYLIIGTDWCEGYVLEDIRTALSSSLKGISLMEEATNAKDAAERGERDAEEFYAKVSEGLLQPLSDMKHSLLGKGRVQKENLIRSIQSAEHILELALAERGELGISPLLIPLSSVLPSISELAGNVEVPPALPLMEIDSGRLVEALSIYISLISDGDASISVALKENGAVFRISGSGGAEDETARQLAGSIVILHSGTVSMKEGLIEVTIPYPRLSEGRTDGSGIVFISEDGTVPDWLDARAVSPEDLRHSAPKAVALFPADRLGAAAVLSDSALRSVPVMLFSDTGDISLRSALESASMSGERTFLVFGSASVLPQEISEIGRIIEAGSVGDAFSQKSSVSLIIMTEIDEPLIKEIRKSQRLSSVPILIVMEHFEAADVDTIVGIPNVVISNTSMLESKDFLSRISSIAGGSTILPPLTGVIVKKAIVYFNGHATRQISRWQVAEAVNISEDYLTRIFRKELGISPWDYLNRYRIQIASYLLVNTAKTLSEIASESGFQDQAYFCRVFKKIKGFSPGHMRQR